jgi:hypothetical protein
MSALEKGPDTCYADVGDGELDSIGALLNGSTKSKYSIPPIASAFGNGKGSILNRQDDPFAPHQGKTFVRTDAGMTLVRSKSALLIVGVSFRIRSYTIVVPLFTFTAYDWCRLRSPNSVSCLPETETTPTLASPS